jgi:hypothetical protein
LALARAIKRNQQSNHRKKLDKEWRLRLRCGELDDSLDFALTKNLNGLSKKATESKNSQA